MSVEHLKRYTTLGMATDQGKMGNIIGLALMAEALGKEIPEVGTKPRFDRHIHQSVSVHYADAVLAGTFALCGEPPYMNGILITLVP
ncbi:MAG: hypothetical protein CM1200mP18_21630 [Gammaproteobacteria bacterium]|nr:MAG: hypothetical protein CM1200mP18_21630 [Gammaproteobacteria bacterium]